MRYNKILFGIVMIIIMAGMVMADSPPYSSDQWGNTNYGGRTTTIGTTIFSGNGTICVPFVARETGNIESFYLGGSMSASSTVYWCIDDSMQLPFKYGCAGSGGTLSGAWFSTSGQVTLKSVVKDRTYYICVQVDEDAGGTGFVYQASHYDTYYSSNEAKEFMGITTPYNNWIEGYEPPSNLKTWRWREYDGWVEQNNIARNFEYCMDGTDDCYVVYNTGSQEINGEYGTDISGEVFKFQPESSSLTDISMMMMFNNGGGGCAGSCTFKFVVYDWNWSINTTGHTLGGGLGTLLYNSTNLYARNGTWTNGYYWQNHTLPVPINLVEDNDYLVGAVCTAGCSSTLNDRMHTAFTQSATSSDFFTRGFQGETVGMRYDDGLSNKLHENADTWFLLTLDDPVVYEEVNYECNDGVDNDADNETDFGEDSDCSSLLDDSEATTSLTNCSTNCTTWSGSYYLKEDFEGDLALCDWVVNRDVCWEGQILMDKTYPFYSIFKLTDLKYSTDSRYYTVSFDIRPADIDSEGYLSLSLYDYDYTRYINVLFGANSKFYNNEEGNAVLKYSNMTTGSSKTMQLHVDLTEDDFDVYYDGSKILSGLQFTNSFLNIDSIYGMRISSQEAGYNIDNLEIYASNQDNVKTVVDEGVIPPTADPTKAWCELFNKETTTCSLDSECDSGECLPNGKCSSFDFTYCDENGHTRGSFCMISAMTSCVLTSTGDLILDNFFLFLIMLVIIMGLVYLTIMLRN